jgi:hypothetical protein
MYHEDFIDKDVHDASFMCCSSAALHAIGPALIGKLMESITIIFRPTDADRSRRTEIGVTSCAVG